MKARIRTETNPRLKKLPELYKLQPSYMAAMLQAIDIEFARYENRLFATEGAAGGQRWRPLSARYARAKARKYPGRKIMQRTGKGRRSLVNRKSALHVAKWALRPRPAFSVGTRYDVFRHHVHKPPLATDRNIIQHSEAQHRRYLEIIDDYYRDVIGPRIARALTWRRNVRRRSV